MSDIEIQIKRVMTGEIRNANQQLCDFIDLSSDDPFFIWEDGNWACDCNRAAFFWEDDYSVFPKDHDFPCNAGEDTYQVRIIDKKNNEILYDEFDYDNKEGDK